MYLVLVLLLLGLWCGTVSAKGYETQQQGIENVFPSGQAGRKTLFLSQEQVARIEQLARAKVDSRIVSYYVGKSASGAPVTAFFDRQIVRDMPVTFMVAVKQSGEIDRVEILSFDEPDDYLPPPRWLQLYRDRLLNDDLAIGHGIPRITGSSLTSQAMNDGIRRALAIYEVGVKGIQ